MTNLKEMLFKKAANALKTYRNISTNGSDTAKERARERLCALFELIVDAGLEKEYYTWKETNGYEL